MTYKPKFYWNEETVNAFKFESNYLSAQELLNEVEKFVENDCSLEDGETEEELVQDLLNLIYSKND